MFGKSLLMKMILAILGFGVAAAMFFYNDAAPFNWFESFPGTIFQEDVTLPDALETAEPEKPSIDIGPAAPEITGQKNENECGTFVWWGDNELHEDNVFFYRRVVGVTDFIPFKVTGKHLGYSGSFGEGNLPPGTYEYKVSVVNKLGEAFSNVSQPITIVSEYCEDNSVPEKPLNPVIISLERINGDKCSVRINYQDNALNEDGIRIYRAIGFNGELTAIAELPASNAPTGFYDDLNLPPELYRYKVSVFHEGGEAFSQYSEDFWIQAESCKTFTPPVLILPTLSPANVSPDSAQACAWTSALNVFIRKGPSSTLYSDITAVVAGTTLPVVGQSEDGQFWIVEVQSGVNGYVPKAGKFGDVSGDCNPPTLPDPKIPTPVVTESSPASNGGSQTPACRDGVDNDGDGYIDMRDRDCDSPEDASE